MVLSNQRFILASRAGPADAFLVDSRGAGGLSSSNETAVSDLTARLPSPLAHNPGVSVAPLGGLGGLLLEPWPEKATRQPGETASDDTSGDSDTDSGQETADTFEEPDKSVIDPPVVDCSALPQPPYEGRRITAVSSEDLAFDAEGYLVGSDMRHIWKSTHAGDRKLFVPNVPFRAGLRALPSGAFVFADNVNGAIVRLEADGTRYDVLTGLSYPNGIEVGPDGIVYFTEHGARRVWRLDPYSGDARVISELSITNPNGLTFELGYAALLIGGFSGVGAIYRLPIDAKGEPGTLEVWAKDVGTGYLDGMGVDVCGNVYIADYMAGNILRLPPDGSSTEVVINGRSLQGAEPYMPNFQWGSGVGGWDPGKIYIPEGNTGEATYEVDLGIPSKPR